jgi:hypothetical protein
MAPKRAPMATKMPNARPALAPVDIPLLAAASDEEGLALERATEAVAEARPANAPVPEPVGTGEAVATMIVDAVCFGDVLAVEISSAFSDADAVAAFFELDLALDVALGADDTWKGSPMIVSESPPPVIHTTGTVKVLASVTILEANTVLTPCGSSSSVKRGRWVCRRTMCARPCW